MKRLFSNLFIALVFLSCGTSKEKADNVKQAVQPIDKSIQPTRKLVVNGDLIPNEYLFSVDSTQISTDSFKGKFLVINFWATWCSPCIKQTPIFNDIGDKFKVGQVEFITISINTEFSYWKRFLLENEWEGNNYWLGMKEASPFFDLVNSEIEDKEKKMVLIAIPKYMIISPDGEKLEEIKIKPSNPEFERKILEIVKKHAT